MGPARRPVDRPRGLDRDHRQRRGPASTRGFPTRPGLSPAPRAGKDARDLGISGAGGKRHKVDLETLIESVLNALTAGITIGCIYGLMCIGLGLIFGIMKVVQFSPRASC